MIGTASGTVEQNGATISVGYSGSLKGSTGTNPNQFTEYDNQANTDDNLAYTRSDTVSNGPTDGLSIYWDAADLNTITFSQAVINPLIAFYSVGQPTAPVTYTFDHDFILLSEGKGYWSDYGSGYHLTRTAPFVLTGQEGYGVIQFMGTFDELNFTLNTDENHHGFTVGLLDVASVPLPAAVWLFGSGLLGLIGFSKRKKAA